MNLDLTPKEYPKNSSNDHSKQEASSQADRLVNLVRTHATLFHDLNHDCYATDNETNETRRLQSGSFKDWMTAKFYKEEQKAVRSQSLTEALSSLAAIARYEGQQKRVFNRIANYRGNYYIDLCEKDNSRAIEWNAHGWRVVDKPDVLFARAETMLTIPEPVRVNGSLDKLWEICNIPENQRPLVLAWLIDAMRPDTPYPGLEIIGEQGSGKSTTSDVLRRLIDPNSCNLRSAPKNIEDIFVSAGLNHVIAYENLSHLSGGMQDALCILSTGGGYAKRKLYTDAEESVINVQRPWMVNGISTLVTAQDLLDRTICIECPIIRKRNLSSSQRSDFTENLPIILGGLFDLASSALKILPSIFVDESKRPRMIEYCYLGMAITQVTDQNPNKFLSIFTHNRKESIGRTIEASPVGQAIVDLCEQRKSIIAPLKEIMTLLDDFKPSHCDSWPRSVKGLGDALRRLAPALRQLDIEVVSLGKINGNVRWSIGKKSPTQCPKSPNVLVEQTKHRTLGHSGHSPAEYIL